jgi:dethiobiotin synthetase
MKANMALKLIGSLSAPAYIITGTDTDVGKTTVTAELLRITRGRYWKPVQSGPDHDTKTVRAKTRLGAKHFLPESYMLRQPLSPHRAAELDGVKISAAKILRDCKKHLAADGPSPLLIEGAGGLMVPITRRLLQIDLFADIQAIAPAPIILVARTGLGTINHTLLSLAAIRARGLQLGGIIFNGPRNDDNVRTVMDFLKRL